MFTKQDEQFDQMATDPARRREGIAGLSWRRNVICWCAVVATLCALATFLVSASKAGGGAAAAIGFLAATHWMLLFKFESDLRLLRVIDRLYMLQNDKVGD